MKPIRVLFVDHTAKLGGGELALASMITHLDPEKVKAKVLLFEEGELRKRLPKGVEVLVLPLSGKILNARKDLLGQAGMQHLQALLSFLPYLFRLTTCIRAADIELVHCNSLKADVLAGLAARLLRKPVIWHLRDRISEDYLPSLAVKAFRYLAHVIPDGLIANSTSTLQAIQVGFTQRALPVREVIHDGFDFASLCSRSVDNHILQVGLVGRISPWKGQDVFLRAINLVRDEFPDAQYKIIGSALFGETAYEDELYSLCEELNLRHCVEFTGFVERINERVSGLDIVVHASKVSEPFGQVIIEGMAAGKPVIATRGGGVSEIVKDGVSGLLVEKNDPVGLASAMRALLASPTLRTTLGNAGRQRVRDHFRIEGTVSKVTAYYERLLETRRN